MQEQPVIGTSDSHPLYVNFIPQEEIPFLKGSLGITFAPGKCQLGGLSGITWQRDLEKDLLRLKDEYKTTTLVTLIEAHEFIFLNIENLRKKAFELDINSIWFPIKDGSVPNCGDETLAKFDAFISYLQTLLQIGENLVIHCMGGMGRAGLITACLLIKSGKNSSEAIKVVRAHRKGAVETIYQEEFALNYFNYLVKLK